MAESRTKKCRMCGLADGHTLINCPNKCMFCVDFIMHCQWLDSSLVRGVMDSETPEKSADKSTSKLKVGTVHLDDWEGIICLFANSR